jgi:predicted ribosome quality control (RQC) complex YloA/Tae2 family protein
MYCPRCKSEFRDGFHYCTTCECSLVEDLPNEETIDFKEENSSDHEVFLVNVRDEYEAEIIESLLRSNDIEVSRKHREAGAYLTIYTGISIQGIDLYVLESVYEEAKELIETLPEAVVEDSHEEMAEEQALYKEEEIKINKGRSTKARLMLLFYSSGILVLLVYLISTVINRLLD